MNKQLQIQNLHVKIGDKPILNGVDFSVGKGETHAIMGPNGSGKSTLAQSLFSHPNYEKTAGQILFEGKDITQSPADEIARLGMLLAFQYPQSISGVTVTNLLKLAARQRAELPKIPLAEFSANVSKLATSMQLPEEFLTRSLNEGFSGGEKKKAEVLQLATLQPRLAVFDETDSGLDVDSLKVVSEKINELRKLGTSVVIITHYQRILQYINPDFVHIMHKGRIVRSGSSELASEIEKNGYGDILESKSKIKDQNVK
jgi:Fe-S cluster assembly ATP-binding protein